MNGITHKQAKHHMRADLDGLLNAHQRLDLHTHLRECDACRAESESLASLTERLQSEFHNRWDKRNGPSTNVMANVHSQTRRIMLMNRINAGLRAVGGVAALLVLMLVINSIISQVKNISVATNGTQSTEDGTPVFSSQTDNRLIAFTSIKDGNSDIYTMRADGSDLTNITNNPAQDMNPAWSPDGTRIVFESDRDGSKQIYLMDFDGSNIVQLTHDEVDHQLPVTDDSRHNIWSSDGNKILFLQNDQDGKTWTLNSININGENKTALMSDTRQFDTASWSPNGDYIGLFLFDKLEPDRLLPNLYVIDANGNNVREIQKFLPQEEHIFFPYIWSSDGQSVIFPAHKINPSSQTVYELRLRDNALNTVATITPLLFDWYDGIALITDFNIESQPLVWLRPDGSTTELDYLKGENPGDCYLDKARSLRGNLAIGSYCKHDDKVLLYWTNRDGNTIHQLPDLEVPVVNGGHIGGLTLSPDEKFVTFNFESDDETNLYIWNIEDALSDSSVQPLKLLVGKGKLRYVPSWQPVINEDITEENLTPEPTQTDNKLLAFTKEVDGNFDIYTMRADGSGSINITNNPAHDANPIWSPDGKHIAFESNRNGFMQIYLMDADGSNVIQFTDDKAHHSLPLNIDGKSNPWSPDGSKLLFLQSSSGGETGHLYVKGINGENKILLASGRFSLNNISWSSNGKYIAYVLNESPTPNETFVTGIYVVDFNGNNPRELKKLVSQNENLDSPYYWSSDGQSIVFVADKNDGPGQTVYEFDLETDALLKKDMLKQGVIDWQDEISLVREKSAFVWQRSDGTSNTLDWNDPNCLLDVTRSLHGNFAIGAYCPDSKKFKLYWANSDGSTIKQLLASSTLIGQLWDITWSPDDQYVAFNISSPNKTDMYVLNVSEPLSNPSIQPVQVSISGGELYSIPSWQPMP
jgi:Tol biopolymer transport system component